MIRVILPAHLRALARVNGEVSFEITGEITQRARARCPRVALPDAARNDSRSRHAAAPALRAILCLRDGPLTPAVRRAAPAGRWPTAWSRFSSSAQWLEVEFETLVPCGVGFRCSCVARTRYGSRGADDARGSYGPLWRARSRRRRTFLRPETPSFGKRASIARVTCSIRLARTHSICSGLPVERRCALPPDRRTAFYDEEGPVWSPDGRAIAFLSDARSTGQLQLFVAGADGRHVRQIGRLNGNVARLTWSPDGKTRGLSLYCRGAPQGRCAGAGCARRRRHRFDRRRTAARYRRRCDRRVRSLTPADSYVYEYGWSPDGGAIAVTYAKGNGDNNWWVARLARVDVANAARCATFSRRLFS